MIRKFLFIFFYVIGYICLAFTVISLIKQQFIGILIFGIPAIISFGIVSYLKKRDKDETVSNLESKLNRDLLGNLEGNKEIFARYGILLAITIFFGFIIYLVLRD